MKKFHVCIVSQQFSEVLSGPGLYTRNLVERLAALGHYVTLIVPAGIGLDYPDGVKVVEAGTNMLAKQKAGWIVLSFLFGKTLRKLANEKSFDIVHFTDAKEALFTVGCEGLVLIGNINDPYIAGKNSNPLFYRKHYPIDWIRRWFYLNVVSILERYTLKKLRLGICNSRFTRKIIAESYDIPSKSLGLCYKSIRLEAYSGVEIDLHNKSSQTVLFVGGGNAQRKGLVDLLHAANIVSEILPTVRYVVVGRDKTIPLILEKYSSESVRKHLKHISYVPNEDMKMLYVNSDLFVMPSLVEAFGVVYLESMACSTAVIGTTNGGATEFISDRQTGLLVKPGDVENLACLIIEGLSNNSLRKNLEENARDLVKDYSLDKMIKETLNIYRTVCRDAGGNIA